MRGHLDLVWRETLAGLRIAHADGGISVLSGTLLNQTAPHGVLLRLIDLGLPLLALETSEERLKLGEGSTAGPTSGRRQ